MVTSQKHFLLSGLMTRGSEEKRWKNMRTKMKLFLFVTSEMEVIIFKRVMLEATTIATNHGGRGSIAGCWSRAIE